MIESLETRKLMSVDLTSKGTLVVTGVGGNDSIVVSVNPKNGVISVNQNDAISSFAGKAVKRVFVAGDSGHDRIHIDASLNRLCTVTGGSGADIIEGNAGSVLIGGSGNDKLLVQPPKFILRTISERGEGPFGVWADKTGVISFGRRGSFGAASYMSGGDGNDTLVSSTGNDGAFGSTVPAPTISGGAGHDTLFATGGTIKLTFENDGTIDGLGNLSGIEFFSGHLTSGNNG